MRKVSRDTEPGLRVFVLSRGRKQQNRSRLLRQALWTTGAALAVTFALLSDNWPVAIVVSVLVVLGLGLDVWSNRRRHRPRMVRLEESACLPWSCETVWDLVLPAENSPQLEPGIVRGYRVPGTPEGLGEQQAAELLDGSILVSEVIEFHSGRLAVSRQVSPPGNERFRTVQSFEPTNGGCIYTVAAETDLVPGEVVLPSLEAAWRNVAHEHIARIEQVLATSHGRGSSPGLPT